ncbi:MAG: DEAD/DEAH box helicase family protein, partial [Synechococcaceae cyanobacterium]|nr:DEAD/DEAH box helicase family protein [Synechococcaceae cyanobacterium]
RLYWSRRGLPLAPTPVEEVTGRQQAGEVAHHSAATPMTPTLRPRQAQALADLQQAYASGARAPILVAPTGFGKTATAAEIVRRSVAKGKRVWFLAHLREILDDTAARLAAAGIPHGQIRAGRSADYSQLVQVVAVQTAVRRPRLPRPDLIIVDECHLAVATTYRKVIDAAGRPRLLGLTGTPQRLDGRGLGEVFDLLVLTCGSAQLVEEGLLAPVRVFSPPGADLSGLHRRCGDFDQGEAGAILSRPAVVGDALSHWRKLCSGRRGVAFCTTVAHAEAVAEQWRRHGYRAMAVHGSSDDAERREAIVGLRAGRLDLVACAQLWIAGVDVPEIDAVIWLRPTQSLTAWLQGNGRGLRIAPGKADLLILDHVGNTLRLGHPLEEHEWSLDGRAKKPRDAAPSVKICPRCFATMPSAKPKCPDCGHQFAPERRELETVDGELVEIQRREQRREQGQAQTLEQLIEVGKRRGMKSPHGWARHVMAARQAKAVA